MARWLSRARDAIRDICDEADDKVAERVHTEVHALMTEYFREPTGYYQSRVVIDRTGPTAVVHDSGVIYGPWLAGTGSRNRTTRFKGYPHWRLARQRADAHVPGIVGVIVARRLRGR